MKIQSKRSGVEGKEPTAGQTDYGELCINFHEGDPALYIKDSNDVIRRVGADVENYYTKEEIEGLDWDTSAADGRYLRIDANAPDQTRIAGVATFAEQTTHEGGVSVTGGQVTLPGGGTGNEALQADEINTLISNLETTVDGLYLSKTSDDTAAGAITFEEATTHVNGVKVTGGDPLAIGSGLFRNSGTSGRLHFVNDGATILSIGSNDSSYFLLSDSTIELSKTNAHANYYRTVYKGTGHDPANQVTLHYSAFISDVGCNLNGFLVSDGGEQTTDNITVTGFNSRLTESTVSGTGSQAFNFYAPGNAPNFLTGSTYIGGNTTRNTFELWKSTLTEEQQEQLEAGTLVAPANVSVPGDGEFARQWWYDQQSAEDQALIDNGELEYPEHFAAATFTDIFALGDNTNINLNSDGTAQFSGVTTHKGRSIFEQGLNIKDGASGTRNAILTISGNHLRLTSDSTSGTLVQLGVDYNANNGLIVNKTTPGNNNTINAQYGCVVNYDVKDINISGGSTNLSGTPACFSSRLEFNDNTVIGNFSHYNVAWNRMPDLSGGGKAPTNLSYYSASNSSLGLNDGTANTAFNDTEVSAFYSNFNTGTANAKSIFVLNSTGTAPSFHNGDVLIGGTATSANINLTSTGSAQFNNTVTVNSSGAGFITNILGDNTSNRNNNFAFQHEGALSVQLRAARPSGAVDNTTTSFQIRVGGASNANRVVTFNPDRSSSFAGDISTSGDISAGTINGSFSLRMQPDDPSAYQTSYSTDEDGEQVEEQTYIGTTENLLDIISDLRARIAELESNTLQPLYQTLADLPDASEHHGKTAHVHSEGALYFAHAGNWVKLQNA
jgi:hypothetical protein